MSDGMVLLEEWLEISDLLSRREAAKTSGDRMEVTRCEARKAALIESLREVHGGTNLYGRLNDGENVRLAAKGESRADLKFARAPRSGFWFAGWWVECADTTREPNQSFRALTVVCDYCFVSREAAYEYATRKLLGLDELNHSRDWRYLKTRIAERLTELTQPRLF